MLYKTLSLWVIKHLLLSIFLWQKYYYGFVREEEEADCVRMHFLTGSLSGFGRWLLMYTNAVRVESPASLVTLMQQFAEELHGHHS